MTNIAGPVLAALAAVSFILLPVDHTGSHCAQGLCALAQAQEGEAPASELKARSSCIAVIDDTAIAVGTTYGVVVYPLPALVPPSPDGQGVRIAADNATGSLMMPDSVNDLLMHGGMLLVANGARGIKVVDVSDKAALKLVASLELPGAAVSLAADGTRLYVAMGVMGIGVVDVATMSSPALLKTIETNGYAREVVLDRQGTSGNMSLLVANGRDGLLRLVLNDASEVVERSRTDLGADVRRIAPLESGCIVALGMQVCHVSEMTSNEGMSCLPASDTVRAILVARQGVLFHNGQFLLVVDWSVAASPKVRRSLSASAQLMRVAVHGTIAIAAVDSGGVLVFDLTGL